jgi:hypothetical protein
VEKLILCMSEESKASSVEHPECVSDFFDCEGIVCQDLFLQALQLTSITAVMFCNV